MAGDNTQAAVAAWAFDSPAIRPLPPDDPWCSNEVDRFILASLRHNRLRPAVSASRPELIRRLYLVMLGVPPMPEQVDAFVVDSNVNAWPRLVDRVLDDSRYGERWAQHWLDVIRWAETVGFETNAARTDAWYYRDWLIRALNKDKPYDQFVFQQLAGDTVGEDAALGFLVAGPANLPGQIGEDEAAMRQARQDELDEVIRTVSQSFLGLTVGCARCHDHKFDPILQRDYYSMQAIFAGLRYGHRRLRGVINDQWTAQLPEALSVVTGLQREWESLRTRLELQLAIADVKHEEQFGPVVGTSVRMRIAATADGGLPSLFEFQVWSVNSEKSESNNVALKSHGTLADASSFALVNQTRHPENLIDGKLDGSGSGFPWKANAKAPAWIELTLKSPALLDRIIWYHGPGGSPVDYEIDIRGLDGDWTTVADTRRRQPRLDDQRSPKEVALEGLSVEDIARLFTVKNKLEMAIAKHDRLSAGPQVYAASFHEPQTTWLLERGDPMLRTEEVTADIPQFLGNLMLTEKHHEVFRRVALAKHLTDRNHPLTARVMMNRVWQYHFGSGLVETASDFGEMGASPSHPELLDWLAHNFSGNGWSLKKMHRLILTSKTFQQSSHPRDNALAVDADSRLLWRFPPRRLEAEAIRDSILSVSGKLNHEMYGEGFDFFQQKGGLSDFKSRETFEVDGWRRMIYATKIRMQSVDIFGAFDCPDAGQMTPKRNRSTTPIQALSLFNSPFVNRQANFFATRLADDVGSDLDSRVERAFLLALSRRPSDHEKVRMRELATKHGMEQVCRVILNTSEFLTVQ